MGVFLAGILTYLIVLKISQKSRPFRFKLTLLFLLFVLLPAVPLTLLNIRLLTQSAKLMLLPGLDEAMQQSIETIRRQSEVPGRLFLKACPDFRQWTDKKLEHYQIDCIACYSVQGDEIKNELICTSDTFRDWSVSQRMIQQALSQNNSSKLLEINNQYCLLVFEQPADSVFYVAGYTLDKQIGQAKDRLSQSLHMYNTVSLLKETILQKNMIMVLAFILLISLVLFSIVIAGKISKTVNEPIDQLVKGMKRVKTGNLDEPIKAETRGEFGYLAASFNQMMHDLKESHQKLIESEKLAAWREVARRMSHEIKNSLTPITLSLRQIMKLSDDKNEQNIKVLQDEFNHLKSLADTFSTFSKMPRPRMAEMSLNDTIRHIAHLLKPAHAQVQFTLDLDESIPYLPGDYEQIKRVFLNLIGNSMDAMQDEGSLSIITQKLDDPCFSVQCEICDTGKGMDEATLQAIFRPYFTTKGKGTGLGMPIVKQILDDHGASIEVESRIGAGTCIRLRFK